MELPGGDKGVSLMANDLADDERFDPTCGYATASSERNRVDCAVQGVNRAIGKPPQKAFFGLFNQFRWPGTTGWEYWSDNYQLMLKHALLVAAELTVPLHVKMNVIDAVLAAAAASGITFEYDFASSVQTLNNPDFAYVNRQIEQGEYVVLTNVVMRQL